MKNDNRSILVVGPMGAGKNMVLGSIQVRAAQENFHIVSSSNLGQHPPIDQQTIEVELKKWQEAIDYRRNSFSTKYLHVLVFGSFLSLHSPRAFDTVICVNVEVGEQRQRLRAYGLSDTAIEQVIRNQTPSEKFLEVPGIYILDTTGMTVGSPVYEDHIRSIWERIKGPQATCGQANLKMAFG